MVRRLLLTGATGFVGSHATAALLERGFEVHALARGRPGEPGPANVTWHEVDLLDPAATDAIVRTVAATHLVHLAWYAEHGAFWDAPENLDWVAASLGLVRSFQAAGGRRAVVAGTCAEYDWSGDCCAAGTPLRPATLYGAAKDAFRRVLEAYAHSVGLSAAWGRIFFTYGPGEQPTRVVASVARAVLAGEPIACSSGTQLRDFLYVGDVASAFAALADSTASGSFDVGSGGGVELRDVLLRLERLAGRDGLVRLGAAPDREEPARIVADPSRLRDEVGWSPSHELDVGLERTLAWWRSARLGSRT